MQKIAEQHGCHQCLWLFGADHEITEVANIPILIYSYILIYPNPDPDSCIPTLIPILIIPQLVNHQVGAMNLFILLELPDGSKELVTPPLSTGVILPGVTR